MQITGILILKALVFTVMTVAGAQVNISIPLSPVPFILSDFFIILGALYMGSKGAFWSTLLYLMLGAAGLPVFSDGAGGFQHFTGPTGGYLLGFLSAAVIIGLISERQPQTLQKDVLAWLTGAVTLFTLGIGGLMAFAGMHFLEAVNAGLLPFIPAATIKGLSSVMIARGLRILDNRWTHSSK